MKIKICGLTSLDDINIINEAKPDFAGFIFAPQSIRKLTFEKAIRMRHAMDSNIKSIGVFVNANINEIISAAASEIINIIQLHGNETNEYIKQVKIETNLPVIKAFKASQDLRNELQQTDADFVLIDSHNRNGFGGTGKTFDWGLIPETNKKIFLAGGLNERNIKNAIKNVNPYCVDINSGVETNGKKDKQKIMDIIKIIKGYSNE